MKLKGSDIMPSIAGNAWGWLQGELGFLILIFLAVGAVVTWVKKETSKFLNFVLMALVAVMFVFQGQNIINFFQNVGNMLIP